MFDEVFFPGEALVAIGALMRCRGTGVRKDVVLEVFLPRERTRAGRAFVWSLPRMLAAQQSTFRFHHFTHGIIQRV